MADFCRFFDGLGYPETGIWCQKRTRTGEKFGGFPLLFVGYANAEAHKKARNFEISYWFDAFLGTPSGSWWRKTAKRHLRKNMTAAPNGFDTRHFANSRHGTVRTKQSSGPTLLLSVRCSPVAVAQLTCALTRRGR